MITSTITISEDSLADLQGKKKILSLIHPYKNYMRIICTFKKSLFYVIYVWQVFPFYTGENIASLVKIFLLTRCNHSC